MRFRMKLKKSSMTRSAKISTRIRQNSGYWQEPSKISWLTKDKVISTCCNAYTLGYLPLVGTLPDITAKPDKYIAKQRLYREKANLDCQIVKKYLQELLVSINKSPDDIKDEDIAFFCKHACVMKVRWQPK